MEKFFAVLGKILLGVILLAGVLAAGYYIGTSKNKAELTASPSPTSSVKPEKTTESKPTTTAIVTPSDTPLPTKAPTKTITGGLESGTSFKKYSLQIPSGWTEKKDITPGVIDKLTLSKDAYAISILQAAIGGGGCLYKDEPDQMMAQRFSDFVGITGEAGQYRRGWNIDAKATNQTYTICQKGTDGSYGGPTSLGAISYTAPKPASDAILAEMDGIVASMKQQ